MPYQYAEKSFEGPVARDRLGIQDSIWSGFAGHFLEQYLYRSRGFFTENSGGRG